MTKFSNIIEEGTAKYLWEEVERFHTTANVQELLNLKQELELF